MKFYFFVSKSIILLTLFFSNKSFIFSQNNSNTLQNTNFRISYHYGWLLPEYSFNTLQAVEDIKGIEVSIEKQSKGLNYWQILYNYPFTGISLFLSGLSNPIVYGQQASLYGYTGSFFIRNSNKHNFFWKLGLGLNYISKKFEPENNSLNIAIGSHINAYLRCALGWKTNISDKIVFRQSLDFSHISNMNMREPNIGLNWLTLNSAILFFPKSKPIFYQSDIPENQKMFEHEFFITGGLKHTRSFEPYQYITSSAFYNLSWTPFHITSIGLGADLFYDSSVKSIINSINFSNKYSWHTGVHAEIKLAYNKIRFGIQQGVYLGLKEKAKNNIIYNRSFVQWKFDNNFIFLIALKSHLHILDHVQIGIGYSLKHK